MTQTVTDPVTGLRKSYTDDGAAHASDVANPSGASQYRWINVLGNTAPAAASGSATYSEPGVRGAVFDSVKLLSTDHAALLALLAAGTANLVVRYAVDAASDAAALILLPDTFPSHGQAVNGGQIRSFNLLPTFISNTQVMLTIDPGSPGRFVAVSSAITRLDIVHELAGVNLMFGIAAVEEA